MSRARGMSWKRVCAPEYAGWFISAPSTRWCRSLSPTPVDESRPLVASRRYPPYDRSKAAAEKEVQQGIEKGLDAVIIYPTAIIGPYDFQPSFFGEALLGIAQRKLPALVRGGFDWVDVRDVVAGAMLAEEKAPARRALPAFRALGVHVRYRGDGGGNHRRCHRSKPVCPLWLAHVGAPFIQGMSHLNGKRPLYTSVSLRALKSNRHISHERASQRARLSAAPFPRNAGRYPALV